MRNILDEMRRMQQQMESLFDTYTDSRWENKRSNTRRPQRNYKQPPADIFETDDAVIASIELPGVNKDDIDIQLTNDGIEITVEKEEQHKDERKGMYRVERRYDGFYRRIPLPNNVDKDSIEATYKNGVLELRMPQIENSETTTQIEVQ